MLGPESTVDSEYQVPADTEKAQSAGGGSEEGRLSD